MQDTGRDRRKHPRRKGFWRAIAAMPGRPPVHCVIRDISISGAFVEFPTPMAVPNRFKLFIEAHDREYQCDVRHAEGSGVGVFFLDYAETQPDADFVRFGRRAEIPNVDLRIHEAGSANTPDSHRQT